MLKPGVDKKDLKVKKSGIANSGKGLFTKVDIPKGTIIVQYRGTVSTWKEADHRDGANPYLYYINRNIVIDAAPHKQYLAGYSNDANGLIRQKGLRNNAEYVERNGKVYIKASRDIPKGSVILVGYGKEYWDSIRYNKKLDEKEKRAN